MNGFVVTVDFTLKPGAMDAFRKLIDENARDPRVVGVIGHRVNRRDDWVRRVSSRVANAFRNAVLRDGVPDIVAGTGGNKVLCLSGKNILPIFQQGLEETSIIRRPS
mgnify:CR=1 FL=1